jgi:hypothetical protein
MVEQVARELQHFCSTFNECELLESDFELLRRALDTIEEVKIRKSVTNQLLWNLNFLYWALASKTDYIWQRDAQDIDRRVMEIITINFQHTRKCGYVNTVERCFWLCNATCDSQTIKDRGDISYDIHQIEYSTPEDAHQIVSFKHWHHFFNGPYIVTSYEMTPAEIFWETPMSELKFVLNELRGELNFADDRKMLPLIHPDKHIAQKKRKFTAITAAVIGEINNKKIKLD